MLSPLPSLIVSGQPYPFRPMATDWEVDLSRAAQVIAHTETEDWLIWDPPKGYSVVAPFRHPEIVDYLKAHYCQLGLLWINPARISAISQQEDRLGLLYIPNFNASVATGYTVGQIANAVRKAGLTHIQKKDFIALRDVLVFDVENSTVRLAENYGMVEIQRHDPIIAIMEASDWFYHEPGYYGNPHQARVLVETGERNGHLCYAEDIKYSLSALTKDSHDRMMLLPWFSVTPGKSINLAAVVDVVRRAGSGDSSWVNMGNGLTVACRASMAEEIQARKQKLA